jgi:hypothetical protein
MLQQMLLWVRDTPLIHHAAVGQYVGTPAVLAPFRVETVMTLIFLLESKKWQSHSAVVRERNVANLQS